MEGDQVSNGDCTNKTKEKVKVRPINEDFYEHFKGAPILVAVMTYMSYIVLNLVGRLRDIMRNWGLEKMLMAQEPPETKDFLPIYQNYEDFYTRNLYRRVRDCWNRPVMGVPGAEMDLVDRVTSDHGWSFEFPGTKSRCLNLGSYNYLGFAQCDGPCAEAVEESIQTYGVGMGSSRQEVGNITLHRQVEKLVAEFVGQEDAIIFSMGFATNSLNIPALMDKHCCVISDEYNHTSLILGIRLSGADIRRFKHNNMESLEQQLRDAVIHGHPRTRRPYKKILIVVEGIYSMEGSIVLLPEIVALKKKYKAYLYLDEAHSIGALGAHGRGVVDYFGMDPRDVDVSMGTFTKSFASAGGYIAGPKRLIDYIRSRSHSTIYGCSMSAPVCSQIMASMRILMGRDCPGEGQRRMRQLAWNTRYFRRAMHNMGVTVFGNRDSPVVPVILFFPCKASAFSRQCLARGLGTVVVGFPATPLTLCRVRYCISAGHTKEMLDKAIRIIDEVSSITFIKYRSEPIPNWTKEPLDPCPEDDDLEHNKQTHKKRLDSGTNRLNKNGASDTFPRRNGDQHSFPLS